ncbi:hypothetical protein ACH49C_38285 [Rhodococcus sp. NPDC019609]
MVDHLIPPMADAAIRTAQADHDGRFPDSSSQTRLHPGEPATHYTAG